MTLSPMPRRRKPEAIAVQAIPAVVRERDLEPLLGVDRKTVRDWERDPQIGFPARINLTPTSVGWLGTEIAAWLAGRPRGICGQATASEELAAKKAEADRA